MKTRTHDFAVVYSIFTNWGWFKHKWITVKWCINAFGMVLGTFWLGQWVNTLVIKKRGCRYFGFDLYFWIRIFRSLK